MILNVYVPDEYRELMEKFKEICIRESSVAQVIRELAAEYVKKHGSGNPSFAMEKWLEDPRFLAYPSLDTDWSEVDFQPWKNEDIRHIKNKAREIMAAIKPIESSRNLVI